MYTMGTKARLALWRECRGKYRMFAVDGPLPPVWFHRVDEHTMVRDGREARLHYGGGIGGPTAEKCRPWMRVRCARDVLNEAGRMRTAESCEHWADDSGWTSYRGVVAALPHGRGWLAGVEWGDASGREFEFGGGWIDCSRIHGSAEDAAVHAACLARTDAEDDREEREREEREQERAEAMRLLHASSASGND